MSVWVTSDTHFGHDRDFVYGPRGFESISEHDKKIIENWNSVIAPNDVVYHLGDVMLNDNTYGMKCLGQLNGNIRIIPGNHDTPRRLALYGILPNVEVLRLAEIIKFDKHNFYFSHHPTITSNLDFDKPLKARLINICGHCHTKDKFEDMDKGVIYHVEMDAHDNFPIKLETALEEIKKYIKATTPEGEILFEPTENAKALLEFVDKK